MTNRYNDGALIRLSVEFKDINGAYQDPSVVYFRVKTPGGSFVSYQYIQDPEVIKESTGKYYMNVDTTGIKGLWIYEAYSTGSYQAYSEEGEFFVQ